MYVLIANGCTEILESREQLDLLQSIYPYPKFRKVKNREDALKFIQRYKRSPAFKAIFSNYGSIDKSFGFVSLDYIIDNNTVFANIDTSKAGNVRVPMDFNIGNFHIDNRSNLIKIKISDYVLDDDLIADHCLVIDNLLECLGEFIDVNIIVPDISVYLALTRYNGENYSIKSCQYRLHNRLGGVGYTIKRGK